MKFLPHGAHLVSLALLTGLGASFPCFAMNSASDQPVSKVSSALSTLTLTQPDSLRFSSSAPVETKTPVNQTGEELKSIEEAPLSFESDFIEDSLKHSPPRPSRRSHSAPTLPRDIEEEANQSIDTFSAEGGLHSSVRRVLNMEDIVSLRKMNKRMIDNLSGLKCLSAQDGGVGVLLFDKMAAHLDSLATYVNQERPQVFSFILTDRQMTTPSLQQDGDGPEAIARIRKREFKDNRPLSPVWLNSATSLKEIAADFAKELKKHLGMEGLEKNIPIQSSRFQKEVLRKIQEEVRPRIEKLVPLETLEKLDQLTTEEQVEVLKKLKIQILPEKTITPSIMGAIHQEVFGTTGKPSSHSIANTPDLTKRTLFRSIAQPDSNARIEE